MIVEIQDHAFKKIKDSVYTVKNEIENEVHFVTKWPEEWTKLFSSCQNKNCDKV